MPFTQKNWIDEANHAGPPAAPPGTPLSAAALEDVEIRVTDYADLKGAVTVTEYGATVGTADSTAAIQSALNVGGCVVFPPGQYRITDTLTVPANTRVLGYGGTLDFSNAGTTFIAMQTAGTVGAPTLLAGNAVTGGTVLNAAGAGFSDGDWVMVGSTATTGNNDTPKGEINRLQTAASMTLMDPLNDDYATADDAFVREVVFKENIGVHGLSFVGPSNAALDITGIAFDRVRNLEITDCSFDRTHQWGIGVTESIGVRLSRNYFTRIADTGVGYGIVVRNACQEVAISDCVFHQVRHGVAHGGSSSRSGVPRRCVVKGCHVTQAYADGFDVHAGCENISFIDNTVIGSNDSGILHQGASGVIANNNITDCTDHGIRVQHLTTEPLHMSVTDNRIQRVGQNGIYLHRDASYPDTRGMVIEGNLIDDPGSHGVFIDGRNANTDYITVANNTITRTDGNGIYLLDANSISVTGNVVSPLADSTYGIAMNAVDNSAVSGNLVRTTSATGTRGITFTGGTCQDVIVTGNVVQGAATGIHFHTTTSYSQAIGNTTRGCTDAYDINGTGCVQALNMGETVNANIASAGTIAIPASENSFYDITGTETIQTITPLDTGRICTFRFTAAGTVLDATGNINLGGNYAHDANDTLMLVCHESDWYELGRRTN